MPEPQPRTAKEHINQLLAALSDQEIQTVERFVEFLYVGAGCDTIETAPLDDEPYTEEQQREDAELIRRIASGEEKLISHEEIMKEFGLS